MSAMKLDVGPNSWPDNRLTLVVKPTAACNYCCVYCKQDHKPAKIVDRGIWDNTLTMLRSKAFSRVEYVNLYFHGGEPLLTPIATLSHILESFSSIPAQKEITIISNLSLLTPQHAALFTEYGVNVCTSLDGPKEFNDISRKSRQLCSAFEATMHGISIMQDNGGRIAGINCTLARHHIGREKEVYAFLNDLGIPYQLNHALAFSPAPKIDSNRLDWWAPPETFGQSFCHLFDLWLDDRSPNADCISFRHLVRDLLNPEYESYECATLYSICVTGSGEVYPCPSFTDNSQFLLGRIDGGPDSIDTILQTRNNLLGNLWSVKRGLCGTCEVARMCEGGCTLYSASHQVDSFCHDISCGAKRRLVNHAGLRLRQRGFQPITDRPTIRIDEIV